MKKKPLFLLTSALILFGFAGSLWAQRPVRTLTLLYSNNINAEMDPCPT